jgi:hypothetical protein
MNHRVNTLSSAQMRSHDFLISCREQQYKVRAAHIRRFTVSRENRSQTRMT